MTKLETILVVLAAVALAAWGGHWYGASAAERRAEAEWATSAVLERCVDAGLTASALDSLPPTGAEKSREILRLRLKQQLDGALRLVPASGRLESPVPVAIPNAIEGLRRAEAHCRGNGLTALADKAASLRATLEASSP